jgi:glycerophosphoryl diester phosphodiesterase
MWFLMSILGAHAGPSARDVARPHPDQPVVIAHRGASKAAPENTLAAYAEAISQGATIAETDVHLTADGAVVVLHDKSLDRTTSGTGLVSEHTLAQVQALDAGSWFHPSFSTERVPTLQELLALVRNKMVLCIEIKAVPEDGGELIAGKIGQALDASGGRDQAIIFSFYPRQIAAAKTAMPDVPALFLAVPADGPTPYATDVLTMARSIGADMIGLNHHRTTATFVAEAHAAGFSVFVYTVDGPSKIDMALQAGVDGIITNQPAQTRTHLDSVRRSRQ